MTRPEPSDELVGKRHVAETEKHWVESCAKAYRANDSCGSFVAFICDLLESWVDRRTELGTVEHAQVVKRCKQMKLNDLDVWNGVKAMAYLLPRKGQP